MSILGNEMYERLKTIIEMPPCSAFKIECSGPADPVFITTTSLVNALSGPSTVVTKYTLVEHYIETEHYEEGE